MADTEVPTEEQTKEDGIVNEVMDKVLLEEQHFESIPGQSHSVEIEATLPKVPDTEGAPGTTEISQESEIPQVVAELSEEGKSVTNEDEQYEEIEEEYEEQYEEDGEDKVVIKKRIVRVKKSSPLECKVNIKEEANEEDVEEEYEEEELDENEEPRTVTKKRMIKVAKKESLIEKEEEYEEEEIDEAGGIRIVKKTRLVKVLVEKFYSFEEVEEEYEEEDTDENGETITVTKRRNIKVPKQKIEKPEEEKNQMETSEKSEVEESLDEEEEEEEIEEEESEEEDVTSEGEVKKERKKKIEVKKVKRRRRKQETENEEEVLHAESVIEEREEAEEKERKSEDEEKAAASLSSAEILLAEERAAMAQQYEILMKLRSEHITLKRKNLFLNQKLAQYFKKQKMDHVFIETKEDPALEQQYLKKLMVFYETNQQMTEEKMKINTEWEAQRMINEALVDKVKTGWDELMSHLKEVAAKLIDPKTGRTVPSDKTVEDLIYRQEAQLKLISECRLAQIKLKRRIEGKKIERQMQHAGKEFNLMDYEKLSCLKEYYMDKITERDIEIEEVSQKMSAMDDTLTQAKEQLRKKEEEMEQEQERLQRMTLRLNNKRANLNMLKVTRHKTEKSTAKIKQQSGLLAYPILLKDFEEKTQQLQLLMSQTEALKQDHRAAVLRIRKLRETIKIRTQEKNSLFLSSSI